MSSAAKLLFDENFGGPIVDALRRLVAFQKEPPGIQGIREFVPSGTPDEEWVPRLATENWIVISADRGKRCGGAKLPQVCSEHQVTHVLLSQAVHDLPQFDKMRAILSVWDQLCQLDRAAKGSRHRLRFNAERTKAVLEPFDARTTRKSTAEVKLAEEIAIPKPKRVPPARARSSVEDLPEAQDPTQMGA